MPAGIGITGIDALLQRNPPSPPGLKSRRFRVGREIARARTGDRNRAIARQPPAPVLPAMLDGPPQKRTADANTVDIQVGTNERTILHVQRIDETVLAPPPHIDDVPRDARDAVRLGVLL